MPETLICIDFDDTLVANQEHFDQAERRLFSLLAPYGDAAGLRPAFDAADLRLHQLGRHRNRFLMAVLTTYAQVTGTDCVPLSKLPELAAIAAHPYDAHPEPKPGAAETLARLRAAGCGPLWLVTAGDAVVQAGRVRRSGLLPYFDAVHVVEEKTPEVFAALGHGYTRRWMVGNSPRSDILPAAAAGFVPLYVRVPTWTLDLAPLPPGVAEFPSFAAAGAELLQQLALGGGDGAPPPPGQLR